jgi:hypothetical protein
MEVLIQLLFWGIFVYIFTRGGSLFSRDIEDAYEPLHTQEEIRRRRLASERQLKAIRMAEGTYERGSRDWYTKTLEESLSDGSTFKYSSFSSPSNSFFISSESKREYLLSDTWNTIRKRILARDRYTCRQCGISGKPLDVHHITYDNLYSENDDELVAVCRECHEKIHEKHGYTQTQLGIQFPLLKDNK